MPDQCGGKSETLTDLEDLPKLLLELLGRNLVDGALPRHTESASVCGGGRSRGRRRGKEAHIEVEALLLLLNLVELGGVVSTAAGHLREKTLEELELAALLVLGLRVVHLLGEVGNGRLGKLVARLSEHACERRLEGIRVARLGQGALCMKSGQG